MNKRNFSTFKNPAFQFVLTMGMVNLFADITYEGGAAANGQFLGMLGANAATISIVAGLGEFLGYSVRPLAGYIADKTGKHWTITFIGYVFNLLAVPALALAGSWPFAAALMLTERIGRAIRKPTVQAMLSYTTHELGRGWVYAVNTALDESGATLGPLIVALVLFLNGSYRLAFSCFLASSILALCFLTLARLGYPLPSELEPSAGRRELKKAFTESYWLYMAAASLFAVGIFSYELVAYHLLKTKMLRAEWIPVFLAGITGLGVGTNLILGKLYDKFGLPVILAAVFLSSGFSCLMFFGGFTGILLAMPLLGIAYATQDTLFAALISGLLPRGQRNFAFGLFYLGYGLGWLSGSTAIGLLYDQSLSALVLVTTIAQLLSLPLFLFAFRREN
jgi:MFS family permease